MQHLIDTCHAGANLIDAHNACATLAASPSLLTVAAVAASAIFATVTMRFL